MRYMNRIRSLTALTLLVFSDKVSHSLRRSNLRIKRNYQIKNSLFTPINHVWHQRDGLVQLSNSIKASLFTLEPRIFDDKSTQFKLFVLLGLMLPFKVYLKLYSFLTPFRSFAAIILIASVLWSKKSGLLKLNISTTKEQTSQSENSSSLQYNNDSAETNTNDSYAVNNGVEDTSMIRNDGSINNSRNINPESSINPSSSISYASKDIYGDYYQSVPSSKDNNMLSKPLVEHMTEESPSISFQPISSTSATLASSSSFIPQANSNSQSPSRSIISTQTDSESPTTTLTEASEDESSVTITSSSSSSITEEVKDDKSLLTVLTAGAVGLGLGGPVGAILSATMAATYVQQKEENKGSDNKAWSINDLFNPSKKKNIKK